MWLADKTTLEHPQGHQSHPMISGVGWGWGKSTANPSHVGLGTVGAEAGEGAVAGGCERQGRMSAPGEPVGTREAEGAKGSASGRPTGRGWEGAMAARKRAVRNSEAAWESAVSWKPGERAGPSGKRRLSEHPRRAGGGVGGPGPPVLSGKAGSVDLQQGGFIGVQGSWSTRQRLPGLGRQQTRPPASGSGRGRAEGGC